MVKVSIRQIHRFVMICVENPCRREPERKRGLFRTAKQAGCTMGGA